MTKKEIGECIEVYTGRKVWPLIPDKDDVDIRDIAHSLSMQCRFNGHTEHFVSVAEHSWALSHIVGEEYRLEALLHDSAEAYLSDVPRPVKRQLSNLDGVEEEWLTEIGKKYGAQLNPLPEQVKEFDRRICALEAYLFMPSKGEWWPDKPDLVGAPISARSPKKSKELFLERFSDLTNDYDARRAS